MINLIEVYGKAVKERVAANNHSSWGGKDSCYVIAKVQDAAAQNWREKQTLLDAAETAEDRAAILKEYGGDLDTLPSAATAEIVSEQVNPSAFRQVCEKYPPAHPFYIAKNDEKGKRGGKSSLAIAALANI